MSKQDIKIREFTSSLISPNEENMLDPGKGGFKISIIGKPGTGKCLGKGTELLMFDGTIKNVEDIAVGDKLMGDDSRERNVLSICKGTDQMFRVYQNTGNDYSVNKSHILTLKNPHGDVVDIPLSEYLALENKHSYLGIKVPVDFPRRDISIDPYKLAEYLINFKNPDGKFIKDNNDYLTIADLYKFQYVPTSIKANSRKIRLEFIAGILDNANTPIIENPINLFFNTHQLPLMEDIAYIFRSIGFNVWTFTNSIDIIKCIISGDFSIIPTRKTKTSKSNFFDDLTTGISINSIGVDDYYGFTIDGNGRFLLKDFTVTHNTTLIKRLLYEKKHIIPVGIAMSGTEDSNGTFGKIFPDIFVYDNLDEDRLNSFIKRQKISKKYLEIPWGVCVVDDCTDDPKVFSKPLIQGIYKNGRQWKMLWILSQQYSMDLKPVIRTNIDGVFIGRENIERNRKVLYENFASVIPTYELFCELMDELTEDFSWLYIHNAGSSNSFEDCVYYWKPKEVPDDFKFGSQEVWEFYNDRYNQTCNDIL